MIEFSTILLQDHSWEKTGKAKLCWRNFPESISGSQQGFAHLHPYCNTSGNVESISGGYNRKSGMLLGSSGYWPRGMGQPSTENSSTQNVYNADAKKLSSDPRSNGLSSRLVQTEVVSIPVCSPLKRLPSAQWLRLLTSTGGLGRTGGNLKHKHFSLQVLGSQERALSSNRWSE